jgi:hypothetical protein
LSAAGRISGADKTGRLGRESTRSLFSSSSRLLSLPVFPGLELQIKFDLIYDADAAAASASKALRTRFVAEEEEERYTFAI